MSCRPAQHELNGKDGVKPEGSNGTKARGGFSPFAVLEVFELLWGERGTDAPQMFFFVWGGVFACTCILPKIERLALQKK